MNLELKAKYQQPVLLNEFGGKFYGRAEKIGDIWTYQDCAGKKHALIPERVELMPARHGKD